VELNPLYHLIEVVRAPFLDKVPSLTSFAVVLLITACGWILTYRVFSNFRKRISYWS
jgi:ABC-type polysaccharide/polyol phosphate export permease